MNQNMRGDILERSQKLFFSKGYRKVTIDGIAASLSISKKTIYKYFRSKKDLLDHSFDLYRENITRDINTVLETPGLPFPEKLKRVLSSIGIHMGGMNTVLFRDIQELAPDLWEKIKSYKHEAAYLRFNKLIEEGRNNGHIKKDINRAVIIALYASAIENLLDPAFINNLPIELSEEIPALPIEVFENAIKIIYEGILTPETIKSLGDSP
ncbi:MAG: TetR/AcrR family transcriptional regulator [Cyclobacteriaceae bacterium]|nr:TetR/AcrR family transcriptional regulator [Cyclobacteriaceae bacterium]